MISDEEALRLAASGPPTEDREGQREKDRPKRAVVALLLPIGRLFFSLYPFTL